MANTIISMTETIRTDSTKKQKTQKIKCCLCGKMISPADGNDPWPVRPESWWGDTENRCCPKCDERFVMGARLVMFQLPDTYYKPFREKLQRTSYKDLCKLF